ncbi:MAG: single-stranded DNA-binding protein [Magnetococcales bacterium]|nr:single-stranded DNA-binding protein [Magnetococcales bacterium]
MPEPVFSLPPRDNQVVLQGNLAEAPEFRFTPTGRLLASLILEHFSRHEESEAQRIELRLTVTALGDLAEWCRTLHPGSVLHVEGRLNQKRWIRDGRIRWGQTELLAAHIRLLQEGAGAAQQSDTIADQAE